MLFNFDILFPVLRCVGLCYVMLSYVVLYLLVLSCC